MIGARILQGISICAALCLTAVPAASNPREGRGPGAARGSAPTAGATAAASQNRRLAGGSAEVGSRVRALLDTQSGRGSSARVPPGHAPSAGASAARVSAMSKGTGGRSGSRPAIGGSATGGGNALGGRALGGPYLGAHALGGRSGGRSIPVRANGVRARRSR